MEAGKEEFLGILGKLYLAFLLAVLPLYVGEGYYRLGDTKYFLFRNVSVLCLGIFIAVALLSGLVKLFRGTFSLQRMIQNPVACLVCAYGICILISAMASPYGRTAWLGYDEWYMGALTQCLLVGIYFVALWYGKDAGCVWILGGAAFFMVTAIGLLQKMGIDPLGLLNGYSAQDWGFSHMLSTLGNNNWLCGYYSVMLAWMMNVYLLAKKRWVKVPLFIGNVAAMVLLCVQGSDGGLLIFAACFLISLTLAYGEGEDSGVWFEKILALFAGMSVFLFGWGRLAAFNKTAETMFQDGSSRVLLLWKGWIVAAIAALCMLVVHRRLSEDKAGRLRKGMVWCAWFGAMAAVCFFVYKLSGTPFAEWGNYRGTLWQRAWTGFWKGNLQEKLIGAGPDCFALYLGETVSGGTVLFQTGHFADAVFTNAHNEWLTQLVNLGILGVVSYAGIFVGAFRRYRGIPLAMLLLGMYGVHSLVSFQQVLNAPFFFLMLGMCEAIKSRS